MSYFITVLKVHITGQGYFHGINIQHYLKQVLRDYYYDRDLFLPFAGNVFVDSLRFNLGNSAPILNGLLIC